MKNPEKIEATFKNAISNLSKFLPDGIIHIDLKFLEDSGLMYPSEQDKSKIKHDEPVFQFHIMESEDRVALFNEKFAVWIAPVSLNTQTGTLVIIGKYQDINNNNEAPKIELGFATNGMYNTSKIILKIIEHYINSIEATDKELETISL